MPHIQQFTIRGDRSELIMMRGRVCLRCRCTLVRYGSDLQLPPSRLGIKIGVTRFTLLFKSPSLWPGFKEMQFYSFHFHVESFWSAHRRSGKDLKYGEAHSAMSANLRLCICGSKDRCSSGTCPWCEYRILMVTL